MRVLVTGATGFVGQALCSDLVRRSWVVRAAVRELGGVSLDGCTPIVVSAIDAPTAMVEGWERALVDIDVVVHLAARVHVTQETERNPLASFRRINTFGTERLARQAAAAGVTRFVYISTIKVNGEETTTKPFSESDRAQPQDPYATSKWEAEQALMNVSRTTGLEVVIVRPPLVYGPGVGGNLRNLMRLIYSGVPLPVGGCRNRRSLLGLDNLVDFLATCVVHPSAVGETFVLSDGEDLSTPDLIRCLAAAMGRPARLLSVPPRVLRIATRMLGKPGIYQRLCGSLQVDSNHARRVLGWVPPQTLNAGLALAAQAFVRQRKQ